MLCKDVERRISWAELFGMKTSMDVSTIPSENVQDMNSFSFKPYNSLSSSGFKNFEGIGLNSVDMGTDKSEKSYNKKTNSLGKYSFGSKGQNKQNVFYSQNYMHILTGKSKDIKLDSNRTDPKMPSVIKEKYETNYFQNRYKEEPYLYIEKG